MKKTKKQHPDKLRIYRVPKEFLGAFKHGHRARTRIFIDDEFSKQLLDRIIKSGWKDKEAIEALSFLTKFNNEYHKNVLKKGDPNALHNTDELRKDCYDRQNAANRDIMTRDYQSMYSLSPYDDDESEGNNENTGIEPTAKQPSINTSDTYNDHEDIIIELIDNMDEIKSDN